MASKLKSYKLPSFRKGYNSYPASKSAVDDEEIPYGQNVWLDDNGSATKRNGKSAYGPQIVSGKALMGGGVLKNTTYNRLIIACDTAWYYVTSSAKTALTGLSFTTNKKTHFEQAIDRLYGANNTDKLAYTTDGATITEQTSNGNVGDWPVYFNQRLYMTNASFPDRIYYSNSYSLDLSTNPPTLTTTNFGTFNTDLTATPKKTAGYIVLLPGGGVEITRLFRDGDYIYATTKRHGVWKIGTVSAANSDGSIAHTVSTIITQGGAPSGGGVGKVDNDIWYYGWDNIYSLGEVAQYQNVRRSVKSGRIKSEMTSVANSGKTGVEFGQFKGKVWWGYQTGTYNDRCEVYDTILNAWSTPFTNINANFFVNYIDDNGVEHFLAGSSDSSDSFLYELDTGTSDNGSAINGIFETKSTDCGLPGLIKRFAFIDVFYSLVYGTLTYQVFIDEISSITGTALLGNSTSLPVGVGSQMLGTFMVANEYNANTSFASLAQNDSFRIECNYESGKKISVRFSNNVAGENFKINGIVVWFLPGSVYET